MVPRDESIVGPFCVGIEGNVIISGGAGYEQTTKINRKRRGRAEVNIHITITIIGYGEISGDT